jgi:hypothetical protein
MILEFRGWSPHSDCTVPVRVGAHTAYTPHDESGAQSTISYRLDTSVVVTDHRRRYGTYHRFALVEGQRVTIRRSTCGWLENGEYGERVLSVTFVATTEGYRDRRRRELRRHFAWIASRPVARLFRDAMYELARASSGAVRDAAILSISSGYFRTDDLERVQQVVCAGGYA